MRSSRSPCASLLPLLAFAFATPAFAEAETARLASSGRALLPIVVAPDAAPRVRRAAGALAEYLQKITGASFDVQAGDGSRGIVVGTSTQFPVLGGPAAQGDREAYGIRTRRERVALVGASEDAVEHAVWDFLFRLGYRQFFPGERWEVIPRAPQLEARIDVQESPAYRVRRIWYGYGTSDYNKEPYRLWTLRNRATAGFALNTGHAYAGIIRALQKEFDAHPEYYALVGGERRAGKQAKICIGNEDLRRLIVEYELGRFRQEPTLDSVSLEPSDGDGWCECEKCRAIGSISDRVVLLANEVASAVAQRPGGKAVGIYAYAHHSPPPNLAVHPGVVVSVATAFGRGELTTQELMAAWSRKGATLGVREYYSVNPWDRDQPGQARGGDLQYLATTIPAFHRLGARFMSAEASDNWGPNGLGYYVASRILWDLREAGRVDEIVDDFLARAFGPAREPMRAFYRQIDGSGRAVMPDARLGGMFRSLSEARRLAAGDPAVLARIDELVLYAHYASLYHSYSVAEGERRQAAFEAVMRHAWRMRRSMLVHTSALYRDLAARDKTVQVPDEAKWLAPEASNPWKSSEPFTVQEIHSLLERGIVEHPMPRTEAAPPVFGDTLALAGSLGPAQPAGGFGVGRGEQEFMVQVEDASVPVTIRIIGGLSRLDRGDVRASLQEIPAASARSAQVGAPAEERRIAPDGMERQVSWQVHAKGLHRLMVSDEGGGTEVKFPEGIAVVVRSSADAGMKARYPRWMAYFYVPKGTRTVGLVGGEHGEVQDSRNRTVFWLNGRRRDAYFVPVPEGESGKFWRIRYGRGDVRLLTVPPYFAPTPAQLLLPADVLARDLAKQ